MNEPSLTLLAMAGYEAIKKWKAEKEKEEKEKDGRESDD